MKDILRLSNLVISVVLASCAPEPSSELLSELATWPQMEYPTDNEPDAQKIVLGERLFFDPIVSIDSSISCASCHKEVYGFADDVAISPGVEGRLGKRNSPSLWNVGYQPYFMREGGVPTLEMQVLVPVQEHSEMSFNMVLLAQRLNANTAYKNDFLEAFGDSASAYTITRALAQYERTLIQEPTAFDEYVRGDNGALNTAAKKGFELFYGKAGCDGCHSGPLMTNFGFYNNGTQTGSDDYGRAELTLDSADFYLFKVPSLRKVALTAPYMHDGSLMSIQDVLEQYNDGGVGHDYTSDGIAPLNLNESELVALEEFLSTL
ncbi:MAG: cytochrome-c peroxidase [Schleiferiaceae bacterium]